MPVKIDHDYALEKPLVSRGPFAWLVTAKGGAASPVESVAEYFRSLARRGLGCASNNTTIGQALGLSVEDVRNAKRALVSTGRLVGGWGTWFSIDGERFSNGVSDDLEALKTILRREYAVVCDARIVDKPSRVPTGPATELVVGCRRMTITEATALAARLVSTPPENIGARGSNLNAREQNRSERYPASGKNISRSTAHPDRKTK